jgi:hypothetical protein
LFNCGSGNTIEKSVPIFAGTEAMLIAAQELVAISYL